jgi:hypothetical protein
MMRFDFFGMMTGIMDETGADSVEIKLTKESDRTTFAAKLYRDEEEPKPFTEGEYNGMRS